MPEAARPAHKSDLAPISEEEQATFFDAALKAASRATEMNSRVEATITVAETSICLVFANATIADRLLPAFQHIRADGVAPDLTVFVWDTASGNVPMPE